MESSISYILQGLINFISLALYQHRTIIIIITIIDPALLSKQSQPSSDGLLESQVI